MGSNEEPITDAEFSELEDRVKRLYENNHLPRLHYLNQKRDEPTLVHVVRATDEGNWPWPTVTVVRPELVSAFIRREAAEWARPELERKGYIFERKVIGRATEQFRARQRVGNHAIPVTVWDTSQIVVVLTAWRHYKEQAA